MTAARVAGVVDGAERARLLAEVSLDTTRAMLDPGSLPDVVARALTEPLAELGILVLEAPFQVVAPWCVWHADDEARGRLRALVAAGAGGPEWRSRLSDQLVGMDPTISIDVPLRARGRTLGVIGLVRARGRDPFSEDERALAEELAERCALALDTVVQLSAGQAAGAELMTFRALAEASPNLIAIAGADGHTLYVNPRVAEAGIDASPDDLWRTVTAYAGEPARQEMRAALATTGHWSGDVVLPPPAAPLTVLADVFSLTHPTTGQPLGTAWIGQDVTGLRAAEAALRAANAELEQFRALVEASSDFIAIAALDGTVMYVNPAGREMVGLPAGTDVSTTTIADYLTPEGQRASAEVEVPAVQAEGHWEGESTLRDRRGGPPVPVAIASFLMRDTDGAPFALATVQRDISGRIASEDAVRELADQRQALLTRLVQAQAEERAEIAGDVHDDTVQALAAVDLRLGLLRRRLAERAPDLLEVLGPVEQTVAGAIERLRSLLFNLEPPHLDQGLAAALRHAAGELFAESATWWTVAGDQEPEAPEATRAIAFRIAREALVNARKHAGAHHVEVVVTGRDGGLEVTVADDGVGLGPGPVRSSRGHHGLTSMRDRAAVAGGRWEIRDRESGGTAVTLWLPIAPPPVADPVQVTPGRARR